MSEDDDSPSHTASTHLIERLYAEGHLSDEAFERARQLVWPAHLAWSWLRRGLMVAGSLLVVAGLVYLLAYSWPELPPVGRFALVEIGIVGLVGVALVRGLESGIGKVALTGTSVMVGAFLVVVGQVYPSGAELWRFFGGWAVLIAGFAVLGRYQPLWLLWTSLVMAGGVGYWAQVHPGVAPGGFTVAMGALGLYCLAVLGVREAMVRWLEPDWLEAVWPRWVLLAVAASFVSLPVWRYAAMSEAPATWIPFGWTWAWCAVIGACGAYFRWADFDRVAVAVLALFALSTPTIAAVSAVVRNLSMPLALLATGLVILAETALLATWLRHLSSTSSEAGVGEVEGG